jgi:ABC-type transport system involved in multi-copper enzyme maturation permease subunit
MNSLQRIPSVFAFEWRRTLTLPRLAWMLALAVFPPALLALLRATAPDDPPPEVTAVLVFLLSPGLSCMLSVFLLATPAISSELEGRSWVYLAVRPYGPLAVVIGKYLVAVSWALPVGLVSAVGASIVMTHEDLGRLILVECGLMCLSCISYSAVFLLIGVIIPKRAMVVGVIYAVVFEVGAAFIPAAVNLMTIQHRLRCILVRGMEMDIKLADEIPVFMAYFGEESTAWHVLVLCIMTALYLVAAALLLRFREFTFASESET